MKKLLAFVLLCALLLSGAALPSAADTDVVKAGTVDELLAAIAPGAVIELTAEEYDLTAASGYGKKNGRYYSWNECYDGFELLIEDVDGLTVRAEKSAWIVTSPRYANVLTFMNCRNITLEGLTVGHTPEPGSCCGGVLWIENSSHITVNDSVLFGCGVTALTASSCNGVTLKNTTLTDCSYSGAEIYTSEDVLFDGCNFCENGGEPYSGAAVYTDCSRYVTLMNCAFAGNRLSYMLMAYTSDEISMLGCESYNNEYAVFYLEATDVTVVNCGFADMSFGNAFAAAENPGRVLDGNGNEISFDALLLMKHVPVTERPAPAFENAPREVKGGSEQHYYEVGTADEFVNAIGSNRVICLTADIDLSSASGYGAEWNETHCWEGVNAGYQLVITGVKDMTVTAKQPGIRLVTAPREANVLTFNACRDLDISGLTIGHTEMPEAYACTGAVLVLNACKDTEIEDCALFGCGTIGVEASSCEELDIEDCEIYDCTAGGVHLYDVREAEIENCYIHDCASPVLFIGDSCREIEIDGMDFGPGRYDRF